MATNQPESWRFRLLRKATAKLYSLLAGYLTFLRRNPATILFGLLFIVPMSLIYIPYREEYIKLSKSVEIFVAGFYGLTAFPAGFISLFLPASLQPIAVMGVLFITGTLVGNILGMVLKGERMVKVITILVMVLNFIVFAILSFISPDS